MLARERANKKRAVEDLEAQEVIVCNTTPWSFSACSLSCALNQKRGGYRSPGCVPPSGSRSAGGGLVAKLTEVVTKAAKLRKSEVFCMIQGTSECLGCKKAEVHSNAPIIPPCPASKRTGEAQYPTL